MADQNEVLRRQSQKVEELQALADKDPSAATIQGLASIHQTRGGTFAGLNRFEEALEDYQVAAALFAQLVTRAQRDDLVDRMIEAHGGVRSALQSLGKEEEAFEVALAEGQLLLQVGQPSRALAHLRPLVQSSRQALLDTPGQEKLVAYVKAELTLGRTLDLVDQPQEALVAENAAADAVQNQGGDAQLMATVNMSRALTLMRVGKAPEALLLMDEAVETWEANPPQLVMALERRAELRLQTEQADGALADLGRAIEVAGPLGPEILRHLYRARSRTALQAGQPAQAREDLQKAVELFQQELAATPSFELLLETMETAFEQAVVAHMMGLHAEALEEATALVQTWAEMAKEAPEFVELKQRVLMARELRERSLVELGRHEEATVEQTAIVQGYQELLRLGAPPHLRENLVATLHRRAESNRALERHLEAAADLAEARKQASIGPGKV